MKVEVVRIYGESDPSVGIYGGAWEIRGDNPVFDSINTTQPNNEEEVKKELEILRQKISEAFEYICDAPKVVFDFEEIGYFYKEE